MSSVFSKEAAEELEAEENPVFCTLCDIFIQLFACRRRIELKVKTEISSRMAIMLDHPGEDHPALGLAAEYEALGLCIKYFISNFHVHALVGVLQKVKATN